MMSSDNKPPSSPRAFSSVYPSVNNSNVSPIKHVILCLIIYCHCECKKFSHKENTDNREIYNPYVKQMNG